MLQESLVIFGPVLFYLEMLFSFFSVQRESCLTVIHMILYFKSSFLDFHAVSRMKRNHAQAEMVLRPTISS